MTTKPASIPTERDKLIIDDRDKSYTSETYPSKATKDVEKQVTNTVDADSKLEADNGTTLLIAFFLMLFFQLGNRIFGRLATYPMHNYPIFMNMVSCAVYIPICFAYIIPMIAYTNTISKEQQEIPKYKFAVMGAYDSLAGKYITKM